MSKTTKNVVTSTDVAPSKNPESFNDLNLEQLREAARAFGSDDEGNEEVVRANLEQDGVTWKMYVKQFKLDGHESIPDPELVKPQQVELTDDDEDEKEVEEVTNEVVAAPELDLAPQQKYLIKFIGENPYFEFGRYKFTQEKPYTAMNAEDAQRALVSEPKKFRQAFPAELEEFYSF
jgi:hypothetical protein